MIKDLIKSILSLIVRVSPKRKYCFMKGLPTFEDSLVSLYRELPMDKLDKVIWSCFDLDSEPPFQDRGKTIYVRKGSLKELYYGVVSKYVMTSHGHFINRVPKNQVCLNVWHGMPLKSIGLLDGQAGREDTYLCATSELYQDIMARSFGVPLENVKVTGIPRNDLLDVAEPDAIFEQAGIDRSKYKKVCFWLPTYRKSVLGYIGEDGTEVDNVFNMDGFDHNAFQAFLSEQECLCILKPHPMAPKKHAPDLDNMLIIDEEWMMKRGLMLYPLLGVCDFLISDISSVMIDFMLLDRPIVVCFEDSEAYQNSRNMNFDPIEDWLPCEVAKSYGELTKEMKHCIRSEDLYSERREVLKKKFFKQVDFHATDRVLKLIDFS